MYVRPKIHINIIYSTALNMFIIPDTSQMKFMDFVGFIAFKLNCGRLFNHYEQLLVFEQIRTQYCLSNLV